MLIYKNIIGLEPTKFILTIREFKYLFVKELAQIYASEEANAIFYLTLKEINGQTRSQEVLDEQVKNVEKLSYILNQLKAGIPIQYLIGHTYFCDLKIHVNSDVLIPRSETEELVNWLVQENPDFSGSILDIGTGSGCIALSLKNLLKNAVVEGLDISTGALEVAKANGKNLKMDVHFFERNILSQKLEKKYDIIVSNPPYIGGDEIVALHKNVVDYEPHIALFSEGDVLKFYKRLAALQREWDSTIYAETSEFYTNELSNWLSENLYNFEFKSDLNGRNRFVKIYSPE